MAKRRHSYPMSVQRDEDQAWPWFDDDGFHEELWEGQWDDSPSVSRMALMYDTGKACAECFAEFAEPNGSPAVCTFCKNNGSDLPRTKFPELNAEAHKAVARRRRKNKRKAE